MGKTLSVVLVEDQALIRLSVRRVLERSGFALRAEARTGREGVEATLRERPDVCLVGARLPDGSGVKVVREVKRRAPATAVVVLSDSEGRDDLIDAIRAGAVGYLLRRMNPERLAHALRGVVEGEAAVPRALTAHLLEELQTQGRRRTAIGRRGRAELSSREWEVLDMLCAGLSTSEIALRLSLSPVTVRRHVSATVLKLGARDRSEAVALAEGRAR
jgi:DNA-binding NarL/FixJ family response regulator